jgi:hypothetical protein
MRRSEPHKRRLAPTCPRRDRLGCRMAVITCGHDISLSFLVAQVKIISASEMTATRHLVSAQNRGTIPCVKRSAHAGERARGCRPTTARGRAPARRAARRCPVLESIGQYGGTLTVGDLTMNLSGGDVHQSMGDWGSNWLRISQDLTHALPNVLKDWEISDDFTEVTCYMRPGMKWSDGEPADHRTICVLVRGHAQQHRDHPRAGHGFPLGRRDHAAGYHRRLYLQADPLPSRIRL